MKRLAVLSLALALPAGAGADELKVTWGGRMQSDLQLRIEDKSAGPWYNHVELPAGPEHARATLGLKLDASYGRFKGVASIDLAYDGYALPLEGVADLYHIERTDPFRIEAQSLYVEIDNLFTDGLDLRVGQQTVLWGVGDQFNPTNNLNADDIRDKLLFGKQAGNFMVKADYWATEDLQISAVLVPLFKPALLPRSGELAPAFLDRLPFVSEFSRLRIEAEQAATSAAIIGAPTVVEDTSVTLPRNTLRSMQAAFRVATTIAEQDIALSFYEGRFDFPTPLANHTRFDPTAAGCDPEDPTRCIIGLLKTSVELGYPRMSVVGLNAAGEIPLEWINEKLHGIGYRVEAALVLPAQSSVRITNDALNLPLAPQPAGEYDYDGDGLPGGEPLAAVSDDPYPKWTVGLDYTFGQHLYVNAQWVHGFPDEHGTGRAVRQSGVTTDDGGTLILCALPRDGTKCAFELTRPRIADYLVLGFDIKLVNNALLLRLFNILDLSGVTYTSFSNMVGKRLSDHRGPFSADGFSAVIYPELNYNFGSGVDVGLGLLMQLGKNHTKFGDPAAGGSLAWGRARFAF